MRGRMGLQELLEGILGSENVWYQQPPESLKLSYPCIIFELSDVNTQFANDSHYISFKRYTVEIIHKNPDDDFIESMFDLDYCSFDRRFAVNNLYHDVFTIYY